ncbi:MAG: RluA family pseudouridine synthase [Lentisphaerae bacterium]|nr:RluA family pseudouridine synthase [Lentisphaerota bacterium]
MRVDLWLTQHLPDLSRAQIQSLITAAYITSPGITLKPGTRLTPGMEITVTIPPPKPTTPAPEDIPLNLLFEDDDILVINKPAGIVVHPAPGHEEGTLVNALLHHSHHFWNIGETTRPGIVHRLDKETSGIMVIAKTERAIASLIQQFKACSVAKSYLALAHGTPDPASGTIENFIGRHPVDRKRMAVVKLNGKRALTHYQVIEQFENTSLIQATIETGRTHQIRVHLAHLGYPLVGDPTYGNRNRDRTLPFKPTRQMLHAAHLAFTHPTSAEKLSFSAPPPEDFTFACNLLKTP